MLNTESRCIAHMCAQLSETKPVVDDCERLKQQLFDAITRVIKNELRIYGVTQTHIARRLGVHVNKINAFANGRAQLFSMDQLIKVASHMGLGLRLTITP